MSETPAPQPPQVRASAEALAAMVREYFALERAVESPHASNRERRRKRDRMRCLYKQLCAAVDFDRSFTPHYAEVVAAKAAGKAAEAA